MKFELKYQFSIDNEELLGFVNDFQDEYDLEYFDTFEEVPVELFFVTLEYFNEFDYQLDGVPSDDFNITLVNEEN
jgi:hypothetical protein